MYIVLLLANIIVLGCCHIIGLLQGRHIAIQRHATVYVIELES